MMTQLEELKQQILKQQPTDQQKDAIFTEELEYLLRAAPGSGKTWTSCRRFVWRGANWPYSSGGLALLSFTNAAIDEFRRATGDLGRRDLLSDPNYVGTFDAFVERFILTPFGHLLTTTKTRPQLMVAPRPCDWQNKCLQSWVESKGKQILVPAWKIAPTIINREGKNKVDFQSTCKSKHTVDRKSMHELMRIGFYTHTQRAYWAVRLLQQRPHIQILLARRFKEIIVDEAQDTNPWLNQLLKALRVKGSRITLIGDPDQCIYEFSKADPTSLPSLKAEWGIAEKPLSKSFRCNDVIASVVKYVGGNNQLQGSGKPLNNQCKAFIVREDSAAFSTSLTKFEERLGMAGQTKQKAAIICRGLAQLEKIRGAANYAELQGLTKKLALAAFHRDIRRDHKKAYNEVEEFLRSIISDEELWSSIDNQPTSTVAVSARLAIWRFVKHESGLPPVSLNAEPWIVESRKRISALLTDMGVQDPPKVNQKIRKTGLKSEQYQMQMFVEESLFPEIRQDTIHKVKGQSINSVLVVGSNRFWNSVVTKTGKNIDVEDRRLAYVAMTRARHLLLISLPSLHFDTHKDQWVEWGFDIA